MMSTKLGKECGRLHSDIEEAGDEVISIEMVFLHEIPHLVAQYIDCTSVVDKPEKIVVIFKVLGINNEREQVARWRVEN